MEAAGIKKAPKEIEKKKYTAELKEVKTFNLEKEPPKRINIRGKELYYLDGWNGIDVVEKLPKSEKVETEWDRQRKKIKQLKALQKKILEPFHFLMRGQNNRLQNVRCLRNPGPDRD